MKETTMTFNENSYAKIMIVGHEPIFVNLNKLKSEDKHPDFVRAGVAVWFGERKEKVTSNSDEQKTVTEETVIN